MATYSYASNLRALDENAPLSQKLGFLHELLKERFEFIAHISVVVYDPQTDLLKTFLDSSSHRPALVHYQARLGDVPSLLQVSRSGKPRVVGDLLEYANSTHEHTQRNIAAGYRSSYTQPMFLNGEFYGFIFFDSLRSNDFLPDTVFHLDPIGRLLALFVISEIRSIRTLVATTKTARHVTARRDCETGAHLDRMSRYSRLIARELAGSRELTDEYIEHLFLFAPLHDIGKVAIPDSILLKSESLTESEFEVMKTHPVKGLEMVNYMLEEFGLAKLPYIKILQNIVYHHHESVDGSGYPDGLKGDAIPLEARIVATADVFDALTSSRPYKPAWSNDKSYDRLKELAGVRLDGDCVDALIKHRPAVETLQQQFQETQFG